MAKPAGKRISGIYIPIELDTSTIMGDLQRLSAQLGSAGERITKSFGGSLNTSALARGFVDINRALGTLRDSARAMEQLRPLGSFQQALQAVSPELRTLGRTLGLTIKAQQELLQRMAENQAINQQVNALRLLERQLGTTREETLRLAQSYGMAVSQMAQQRYLGNDKQVNDIQKLIEEYQRLAKAAGQAATPQGQTQYINTQRIKEAVAAFRQLNPNLELTRKYYQQIAQAAGVATSEVAAFIRSMNGTRGIMGIFTPSNLSAGIQSAMGAAGVVGGMYGVVELAKSAVNASIKMENLTKSFESIYNSSEKANAQLNFIRQTCDKLGLSFVQTAEGAKGLFASAQGTILENKVNKIYTAFANAGAALKLTGDQLNGIFLAVNQVLSKNQVMAEELKLQIGERLPGAVSLFAKSIGVSTKELSDMMTKGQVGLEHFSKFVDAVNEKYKMGAENASQALQKQINRLGNEWFDLKRKFVDSDSLASGVKTLATALKFLAQNADGISTVVSNFAKFVALTAGIIGVSRAIIAVKVAVVEAGGAVALATSIFTKFGTVISTVFTPVRVVSAALAGLFVMFSSMEDELSPAEKAIKKFTAGFDEASAQIDRLNRSYDDLTEKQRKVREEQLKIAADKAFKEAAAFFEPQQISSPVEDILASMGEEFEADSVDVRSAIEKMFDDIRGLFEGGKAQDILTKAQATGEQLWKNLQDGIKRGASVNELNKLLDDARFTLQDFQNQLSKMDASDLAIVRLQKIQVAISNAGASAIEARKPLEEFGSSANKLKDVAVAAETAANSISKLAKGTEADKATKLSQNIGKLSRDLIALSDDANVAKSDIEKLGEIIDHNSEQWTNLQTRVDRLDKALPQVASYAIKNGQSFDIMAQSLWDAGVQAGYTYDQLMKLHEALRVAFNVEIGKVIEKSLDKLNLKIATIGATTTDKTAFDTLSELMGKGAKATELFAAVQTRDSKKIQEALHNEGVAIKDIDAIIKTSEIFGTKSDATKSRGGSRSSGISRQAREAQKELTDLEKAITSTEKKIGALQSKIEDDPSKKYWADVKAEIEKINTLLDKQTDKHSAQVSKLKEVRDEYERLAGERAKQMEKEERRQKAIQAQSLFGQGWGKLGDVNRNASPEINIGALQAQYNQNVEAYRKMVDDKLATEADFNRMVEEMNEELAIKTAQANGSMLASFTAALKEAAADLVGWQDKVSNILINTVEDMSDAFADFVVTGMKNTEDLGQAFKGMVDSMIQELGRLFMKMIVMSTMSKLFGSIFGSVTPGASSGGGQWDWISNRAAKGGVFEGGNIAKFSGRVVQGPTIFSGTPLRAFASGGNIMGEKGPEAILPLKRGSGGKLGVEATTAATSVDVNQAINVNVYNNTDSQVKTTQTRDENGNLDIQIMIEKMVGESMTRTGSSPFRALRETWSASPKLASRG